MLFIGDRASEPTERGTLAHQRMGTDHDITLTALDPLAGLSFLSGGHGACQQLHTDVCIGKHRGKGLKVLLRQDLGRRHKRCLKAVFDGVITNGGTYGGLARADVALDQAIHRRRLIAHIGDAVADGTFLRVGKLIW